MTSFYSTLCRPTHIKNRSKERKILNIGIEFDDENEQFVFSERVEYEPTGALAIDYNKPHSFIQPPSKAIKKEILSNFSDFSIATTNGNGVPMKMDFRKALISTPPAAISNGHGSGKE